MNQELIQIAFSSSSHGIKGEFTVKLINDESRSLKNGMTVYLKKNEILIEKKIEAIRFGNKTIMKLVGIDDRNLSDELIPCEIYIKKLDLPDLRDGEFYMFDLLGIEVFDERGDRVGELIDFYDTPASTVLKIKTSSRVIDVIFNEYFIKDVDIENKKITIVVPEYLE